MADTGLPKGYKLVKGDLDQPQSAAQQLAAPTGPTTADNIGGLARDLGGSAIAATGGLIEGASQFARKAGKNWGFDTGGSAADMLAGAAQSTSEFGKELQQGAASAYREKVAGTRPSGELNDLSSWSAGPDPSLLGAASLLAQGLGSAAPTLAAGAVTRGRFVPSAAVAAGTGGGFAAQDERQRILGMKPEELAALPGYQERLATMTPAEARVSLAEDAATGAFQTTAPVSAADALFQVLPFTGGAQRALAKAVGTGRIPRALAGGTTGAIGEGLQEVSESAAQRLGSQGVTGEQGPIFEDTLSDFVLGNLVGGTLGGVGALATSPEQAAAQLAQGQTTTETGETLPPEPVQAEVESVVVDPAAGPLSRMVATDAAARAGSGVVTPVQVSTTLADADALEAQGEQQQAYDQEQQRAARKQAAEQERLNTKAANDASASDGIPAFITLAMRRDLAAMGYQGAQIAAMKPAEAWRVLQQSGAPTATPADPTAAPAATTKESTNVPEELGRVDDGNDGSDAGAPVPAASTQGAGEEGRQEGQGQEGQEGVGQEVQEHPAGEVGPRRGEIGGKLAAGEVVTTSSGRETTPFPKIDVSTDRKMLNTQKRADAWLMQNALDEATSRGDDFNARQFEAALAKPQQADRDAAEEYLFGEQPPVLPSILKPLTPEGTPNEDLAADSGSASTSGDGAGAVPADAGAVAGEGSSGDSAVAARTAGVAEAVTEGGAGVSDLEQAQTGGDPAAAQSGDTNAADNDGGPAAGGGGAAADAAGRVDAGESDAAGASNTGALSDEQKEPAAGAGAGATVAGGDQAGAGTGGSADQGAGDGSATAGVDGSSGETGVGGGSAPSPDEQQQGDGAAGGERDGGEEAAGVAGPLTEDQWAATGPGDRRKAIDKVIAAGGMRAGLTPRVLWKNLTPTERERLGAALHALRNPTATSGTQPAESAGAPAGQADTAAPTATQATGQSAAPPADETGASAPASEASAQAPPSGQDQEPADRQATEAQDDASDTSLGGGEPNGDATDPSAKQARKDANAADTTTDAVSEPRTEKLEDAGEELIGVRSWRNKLRAQLTGDREKDAAKLLDSVGRVDAFRFRAADGVTPGALRYLDRMRNALETFAEFAVDQLDIYSYGNAPRQRLLERMTEDAEVFEKVEELAAQYMADLGALGSILDGVANVAEAETRLREGLIAREDTTKPAGWTTDLGEAVRKYFGNYSNSPGSIANRIEYWAEQERSGESNETAKTRPLNRPKLDSLERTDLPDYRGGRDVTSDELMQTFGFRGVNYGEYVNAKERQLHTNHAFDALHDLSKFLGVPVKAMSLGGTMGLSIGKEGSGKFAAHFEPGAKIINITKGRGDGSLAHEWGHAFSDYLREHLTKTRRQTAANELRWHLGHSYSIEALKDRVNGLLAGKWHIKNNKRAGAKGGAIALLEDEYWRTNESWGVLKETSFQRNGNDLGKSYWGTDEEMWARAFEGWVYDGLGGYSPYLVTSWVADGETTKAAGYRGTPYPQGEERAAFAEEFKSIMAALTVAEDGSMTLGSEYETPRQRQIAALRKWSSWAVANIDELYAKAVGGAPSANGLFWYHAPKGREAGNAPKGYAAYGEAGSATYLGYPELLTAAQVDAFKMKATSISAESSGIVMVDGSAKVERDPIVDALYNDVRRGRMPMNNIELRQRMSVLLGGGAVTAPQMKQAQEALETAIVMRSRELVAAGNDDQTTFDKLLALYQSQPLLNVRTSTSVLDQAYSTPAPLAFLASRLAGVDYSSKVYEPTAGNGMLLIGAAPANVSANELNPERVKSLRMQGIDAREGDAMDAMGAAVEPGTQDAVLTNPPFDNLRDDAGKPVKQDFDGYAFGKLDQWIAADALRALRNDGKATLIIGANKQAGEIGRDDRIFLNWLYSHYNVTGHFEVDGKLYERQGATWPVRVITVNGRVASESVSPMPGTIARVSSWKDIYEQFGKVLGAQERAAPVASDSDGGSGAESGRGTGGSGLPGSDAGKGRGAGRGGRTGGDAGGTGNVPGNDAGAGGDPARKPGERVAAGADEQPADAGTPEPDRLEQGDGAEGDAADAGRTEKRAGRPDAKATDRADLTDADNAFQTTYTPRSSRADEGVLVPINMADPLQRALMAMEDDVGSIDDYAAKELGYKSVEDMHDVLMGLQVDSVAMAIYQHQKRGKAVVIADQTGIGKGRQAAAMIRWAQRKGMVPVFVTVKPSLFTDMYYDMQDIKASGISPFVMNDGEGVSSRETGKLLFKTKASKDALAKVASSYKLPDGSQTMFMTYSQIQTLTKGKTSSPQRDALRALAENAFLILDESHNAGGESNTGEFMREVLTTAKGVTYLSATYAKRPDSLPIYFRTDIGDAIEGGSEALIGAMTEGGLPLQTVVSNGLVQAGQMFRRERSYDGVTIETNVDTSRTAEHEKLSDRVTEALRSIVEADGAFRDGYVAEKVKEAKARGEAAKAAGNSARESVNHTAFTSTVHNFVKQMLLGMKAATAADRAIAALKRGDKPIIALENTMGSFLNEYAEANGLAVGDLLGDFDYRTVLSRALERTRFISTEDTKGKKSRQQVGLHELDGNTRRMYQKAQAVIDGLSEIEALPVSPVDAIRHRIQQAGYTVGEITGRNLAVDYSGEKPKLTRVPLEEQKDKVLSAERFKNRTAKAKDRLDVLILNVSGSTGISLHASQAFKNQSKRHMIVAQPASDINIFMQMLGRIHRTGQVVLPSYEILNVDLPAEKRPTALLNKKMKSLNANTSSNSESATSIKSADILNKYGDQIVNNYLYDNQELARTLEIVPADPAGEAKVEEDLARKVTGRMALMPVATQLAFYEEVEQQYNDLIDYLNKTGQNDLEARVADFDAELVEEKVILEAKNPDSPFGGESVYGEYRIKAQGKAMTIDEIKAEASEHLAGKTPSEHAMAMIADLDKMMPKYPPLADGSPNPIGLQEEEAARKGRMFIREHAIGSLWRVEINGDVYNAAVTNLRNTHKKGGNPYSMSKTQVTLALNGPLRQISIPASQWAKIEIAPISGYGVSIENAFRTQAEGSQIAKIVTGNLLGAYGELRGTSTHIISFTKKDGTIEQGILLPKKFDVGKNTYGDVQMRTADDLLWFLSKTTNPDADRFGVASRDQSVRVLMLNDGGIRISTPKSKARGGKYFLNKKLLAVTGDFASSGDLMNATVPKDKAKAALDVLMSNTALYASPSMAEDARAVLSLPRGNKSLPDPQRGNGWVDTKVLDAAVSRVTAQWRGDIPFVRVVTLPEELPAAAKVGKGWETAEGWYDGDRAVYLVAGNIQSTTRGLQVLAHEAIGHYGVEAVLGKAQWTHVVGDVAKLRRRRESLPPDMRGAMDSAIRRYGDENASTFAREFLAIMAERNVRSTLMARIFAAVRRWLRSMGFPIDAWAADELRTIVAEGAKQVTKRRKARQNTDIRGGAMSERASPFFSAMVEAVEKAQGAPKSGTAAQWKGWLDGAQRRGEFRQVERDWLGVDAWLAEQTGPVSRDAIADYVRSNQVRVEEVEYGKKVQPKTAELIAQVMEIWDKGTPFASFEEREDAETLAKDWAYGDLDTTTAASQLGITRSTLSGIKRSGDTAPKYPGYQLPGGSNYRELLLTLPEKKLPPAAGGKSAATMLFENNMVEKYAGESFPRVYAKLTPDEVDRYEMLTREDRNSSRSDQMALDRSTNYQSSHWRERNVLAHVRYNERTDADGKRVLFIEEIQSDFGQDTRKSKLEVVRQVKADFDGIVERMKAAGVLSVECD